MKTQVVVEDLKREFVSKKGIIKREKTKVEALKGISFDIYEGEIFGLLGENGAGKTTTIKILTTLLLPTSGKVRVLDYNPVKEADKIRLFINFVYGGERSLYWRLTARENLNYFSDLYKLDASTKKKKVEEVLELVKLTDRADERVETYSKGMKQRLQIARGLLNDPKIIFLDEPTIGLDPVGARDLRAIVSGLKETGKTILLTTHYMYEADELCDRIGIMKKGEFVALDTPQNIKRRYSQLSVITIEVLGIKDALIRRIKEHPLAKFLMVKEEEQKQILEIHCESPANTLPDILHILEGQQVLHIGTRESTLEDTYLKLIGGE